MKKIWVGIIIIMLVVLAAVFIVIQARKSPGEIEIGVISSLTGTVAPYGERAWEGIQLAVDEINKQHGINGEKIKLLIEDDKSSSSDAVSAFRKLIDIHKVPVVLGPVGSSQAMACAPIANEKRVVEFSPAAATPLYTNTGDFTFRNRASAVLEVEVMADIAYKNLGMRRVAILYINNDVGVGFYPIFKKTFESLGGSIVGVESFDQGASDMRTQLLKIRTLNPDGIYLIGHVTESGYALKQAKELGIKSRFIGHLAMEGPDLFKIAGDAAEGVIYTATGYDPNSSDPRVQEFEKKYRARFHKDGDVFAATAYDAIYIIRKAIEIGGYSAEGIKNVLYTIKDFPGVSGLTSFDENGDVIKPVMAKMVKDQKFIVITDLNNLK
jgi:branched-chain amino acid transport system substrate-binding protein